MIREVGHSPTGKKGKELDGIVEENAVCTDNEQAPDPQLLRFNEFGDFAMCPLYVLFYLAINTGGKAFYRFVRHTINSLLCYFLPLVKFLMFVCFLKFVGCCDFPC